jgi:hypothetical protein
VPEEGAKENIWYHDRGSTGTLSKFPNGKPYDRYSLNFVRMIMLRNGEFIITEILGENSVTPVQKPHTPKKDVAQKLLPVEFKKVSEVSKQTLLNSCDETYSQIDLHIL